jgi:polysaccharide export outer membrane protein
MPTPNAHNMKNLIPPLLFLAALLSQSACVNHRDLVNFRDAELPIGQSEPIVNPITIRIQTDDVLDIKIYGASEKAIEPFLGQQGAIGGQRQGFFPGMRFLFGYRVDQEGYINFPYLGRQRVVGLTTNEAEDLLREGLKTYLTEPVVDIQFVNFRLTILGEVLNPGSYNMLNDVVTIFDLLGQAGDMTPYANRTNILVIREKDGRRQYGRLNLQRADVFQSSFFYLTQNDVVYVEPLRARIATVADPAQRAITYVTAGLSIVTLIIAVTR